MNPVHTSRLRLGLPSGLFPPGFPIKILYAFLFSDMRTTCSVYHNLHFGQTFVLSLTLAALPDAGTAACFSTSEGNHTLTRRLLLCWPNCSTGPQLSRVLLENLRITQLVKKFPAVYERFIAVCTRALHWMLSRAKWIQPTFSHPVLTHLLLGSVVL
jgi:hypothetical protein